MITIALYSKFTLRPGNIVKLRFGFIIRDQTFIGPDQRQRLRYITGFAPRKQRTPESSLPQRLLILKPCNEGRYFRNFTVNCIFSVFSLTYSAISTSIFTVCLAPYTMMAKPMKTLALHNPLTQFSLISIFAPVALEFA